MRGIGYLIKTESSIKVQVFFVALAVCMGIYFQISIAEWLIQTTVIGLVLVAEALNTGIEKLSDFVHPDYHQKIGLIKDITAGAAGIAAIISLIVGGIIYLPKIVQVF